jgi:4-aminobutyrate aminotransferase-like enzyme
VLNIVGYHKHVIALAPSLEITNDEIDLACKLLDMVITRAKNS